jgi:pimeloyl-ACP methyl ester carboxylesterase
MVTESPKDSPEARFEHHHEQINGLEYHVVTCGSGPAVLFCHGFPDFWRVWRHQMEAVADAGFTAIAPDLRGFGQTESPREPTAYTVVDVVGDLVDVLNYLGISRAVIVGHDWGANISWAAPVLRPDRFPAVASLAVPYTPRPPKSMPEMLVESGQVDSYMVYFNRQGPADIELDADPAAFIRRLYYTLSGDLPDDTSPNMRVGASGRLMDSLAEPPGPMAWFDDDEIALQAAIFEKRGFTSALNTYRSMRRSWELLAAWKDRTLDSPALYVYGDREIVVRFPGRAEMIANLTQLVPKALPPVVLPGVGHWLQLEAPQSINRALLEFLQEIGWAARER